MVDFFNNIWGWIISAITLLSLIALFIFTASFSTKKKVKKEPAESVGHVWDEDLYELNNPLPAWWRNLFYITLFWGAVYLIMYPGLGHFAGFLNWTQKAQYDEEILIAKQTYDPIFARYQNQDIPTVATNSAAMKIGARLYASYCTGCHGSDAQGAKGFPNLRDNDWLYGGEPEAIETSIENGRFGIMPGWKEVIGAEGVDKVTEYVLQLAGRKADAALAEQGKAIFSESCAACHNVDGKGNTSMGAPNLTDKIWLYGGSKGRIHETIALGRSHGQMPAHGEILGKAKVHLLAAYIFRLSHPVKRK